MNNVQTNVLRQSLLEVIDLEEKGLIPTLEAANLINHFNSLI